MPSLEFPRIRLGMSNDELANMMAKAFKDMEWLLNGNVDSFNVRNIAGYKVGRNVLMHESGIVGMNGADPTNPDAIRFWSGLADMLNAPFRVQQNGYMYSTRGFIGGWDIADTMLSGSGIIQGGTIRSGPVGAQRIELSNGSFNGYTADNLLSGLVFNPIKALDIVDLFIYHRGAQLLEFYDSISSIKIRPGTGSSQWTLGVDGKTTYGDGSWEFLGSVNLGDFTASGKVEYAGYADAAASSSSADSVDWGNVTNHPDPTTTPLMDGTGAIGSSGKYAYSDHRHPSDTSRAPVDSPTFTGTPTAPTPANSDNSTKIATTAFVKTQESWTDFTFQNSWTNFSATYGNAGYYKDQVGTVHIRGVIKGGTGSASTVIANLPIGYRPLTQRAFSMLSNNGSVVSTIVEMKANGDLIIGSTGAGNTYLLLDGISFRAEQ